MFSDKKFIKSLKEAASKGVRIEVITANKATKKSPVDSNAAGRAMLDKATRIWAVGGVDRYYHTKMILADYGKSNACAFIGSQNTTDEGLDRNRELGIILTDPDPLRILHSTFVDDWKANEKPRKRIPAIPPL